MSIKVCLRIRPNIQNENPTNSFRMENNKIILKDQNNNEQIYNFDYSFWSYNGFQIQNNGQYAPQYSDQLQLFNTLGQEIILNAFQGQNCTLFTFGQTQAGKKYTLFGEGANVGLFPRICQEVFNKVQMNQEKNYKIYFSIYELYKEEIQDLLIPVKFRVKGGLQIKEQKDNNIIIEKLKRIQVTNYQKLITLYQDAMKNGTIGQTLMGYSLTILNIIIQVDIEWQEQDNKDMQSRIQFIKMQGSEYLTKIQQQNRLQEASKIHLSLKTLEYIIYQLANKNTNINYGDSCLTKIMQESLKGNTKTWMISLIKPNVDEITLNTLKIAMLVKQIYYKQETQQIQQQFDDPPYLLRKLKNQPKNQKIIKSILWPETHIGAGGNNPIPQINLDEDHIFPNHAVILMEHDNLYIKPFSLKCGEYIHLNGEKLFEKKKIQQNDRLVFGKDSTFLLQIPYLITDESNQQNEAYDWEFAQNEILQKNGLN